jgi:hypothetical protein
MRWFALVVLAAGCAGGAADVETQDVDVPEFGRADVDCALATDEVRVPYDPDAIYQLRFCWGPDGAAPGTCEFGGVRLDGDDVYMDCAGNLASLHLRWVAP